MKIIFLGSADFSVPTLAKLIEAGHEIACIYSQPPRRSGRGKKVNLTPHPNPMKKEANKRFLIIFLSSVQ